MKKYSDFNAKLFFHINYFNKFMIMIFKYILHCYEVILSYQELCFTERFIH